MAATYWDFVSAFPEFANPQVYSPAQVGFWLTQAPLQLNCQRFGASFDLATMLFVAHNLVLSTRAQADKAAGKPPGEATGPVASKAVGPASISFTSDAAVDGAGAWNYTTYGQRLYAMMRAFGAGPAYRPGPRRSFNAYGPR